MRKSQNTLCLIFAVVDDFCKHLKRIRHKKGPKYKFSRNQILKMMILKNLLGITSDRSFIRFLRNFGRGLFRKIPDHSVFNRRSKDLLSLFEAFRRFLLTKLQVEGDSIRLIDSTPVPVVRYRRGEDRLAKSFERATFGYCATQDEKYFGFKLHLLTTSTGLPTHFDITEASLPDVKMLEELTSSFNKLIIIGDKGYQDLDLKDKLLTENKLMITPDKKNQKRQLNNQAKKQLLKFRKRIEITINQLKDQFNLAKLRAKNLLGLVVRIMGVILTMTLAVFVNRHLGRPDFKIKELLL
ncbi:MAG: IS982 family transposase [Bacillota bacterium]